MNSSYYYSFLSLVMGIILSINTHAQSIYYVTESGSGNLDGTTWNSATNNIQTAIDMALAGDQVWVSAGLYHPGLVTTSSIIIKEGVDLYGGFSGMETSVEQRDLLTNITTISGDINNDDLFNAINWYDGLSNTTDNSLVIINATDIGMSTIMDGFTIQSAYGASSNGLLADNSNLMLNHCLFYHNYAIGLYGAGILCTNNSTITLNYCQFIENFGAAVRGIGLAINNGGQATVNDCDFSQNVGIGSSLVGTTGGAIYNVGPNGPLVIHRSVFDSNVTRQNLFTGNQGQFAGAIFNAVEGLEIYNSVFKNNSAHLGGALVSARDAMIVNCLFDGNVASVLPSGGEASFGGLGAAIYTFDNFDPPLITTLINCTVVNNHSKKAALFGRIDMDNCILWNNTGTANDQPPIKFQFDGNVNIESSCVQFLLADIPGEDPPDPNNYPGSIDLNPMFVDATSDYHLMITSPCIDSGNNALFPMGNTMLDGDGLSRFLDEESVPDTGMGNAPIIDMGIYEFHAPTTFTLHLQTMLQGPFDTSNSLMRDILRQNSLLPTTEPYTTLGYNHGTNGGGETTSSSVLGVTGNSAIVDWMVVELRDVNDPSIIVDTKSVLLQRNGTLVQGDGSPDIEFALPASATVLIALRHRNHFGVRTMMPVSTNVVVDLNFSDSNLPINGGTSAMNLLNGLRVMISGDANGDGTIGSVDRNAEWRIQNGIEFNYFLSRADHNLDGLVNSIDQNNHWRINNGRSASLE